jgi:hypothetical protein
MNIQSKEHKIIEDIDNKSSLSILNDISHSKTFCYLFILNESLVIENQLPFNIECQMEGNIKKKIAIRPLKNKYFLDIDKNYTKLRFALKYQKKYFKSDFLDIRNLGQNLNNNNNNNEMFIQLYEEMDKILDRKVFIECNIKIEENIDNDKYIGAYEKEFEHNVK